LDQVLTRLEVQGFKNLVDVNVDFAPYTCIAGPNAVGKSNLFDVIEFLSLLADHPFQEAARRLRLSNERGGDPRTLFTLDREGRVVRTMRIAAEMIVGNRVTDDFGREDSPRSTFLRYELELEHTEHPAGAARPGSISLVSESLRPIPKGEAHAHIRWPHSAARFRDRIVINNRFGPAYVSTEGDGEARTLLIHADGGSRGNPRRSRISGATRTAVSGATSADEPTLLAARLEMVQWRKLALEPSAMRTPDDLYSSNQSVSSDGSHLAAALWRLGNRDHDTYSLISANASELADIREVRVAVDEARETLTLEARLGNGALLPARSLSDGTLRFLALCVIEVDPDFRGVICMEEPENGIHPAKVPAMVGLLRRMTVDPTIAPGDENPLRQVIVNTHSPEFVRAHDPNELLLAHTVTYSDPTYPVTGVGFLPMAKTWRARPGQPQATIASVASYLQRPSDSPVWQKLELPMDFDA